MSGVVLKEPTCRNARYSVHYGMLVVILQEYEKDENFR